MMTSLCSVRAATVNWTGLAGDNLWDTAGNWSSLAVPNSQDDVRVEPVVPTVIVVRAPAPAVLSLVNRGEIWIHGNGTFGDSSLSVSGNLTNFGTIRMESTSAGYAETLAVGGTLMNESGGNLQVNLGSGGSRYLNANVINDGTIQLTGGVGLYANASGRVFQQRSGIIAASGWFVWDSGRFNFEGGNITGPFYVYRGSVDVADTAGGSTIYLTGNCTLLGNRSTTATLQVQGNGVYGDCFLYSASGAVNAGTIRLESIHGGYRSVMVASGPEAFLNLPGGVLDINGGSGGERWFSGLFINQGIVDARDYFFDIHGSYETAGGRILGAGRLQSVQLSITGVPSEPSLVDLWGSTTLLTDNLPNTTLWIHGNGFIGDAVLTKSGDLNNRGTIRLESGNGGYSDTLNVSGKLMNTAQGVVEVNLGSGGSRYLNANVINDGTIQLTGGVGLYANASGRVFQQRSGIIAASGWFVWDSGRFNFEGGNITGPFYVYRGSVDVADTAGESTIYLTGNCTLLGNRSTTATLQVQGNGVYGDCFLYSASGAVNAGTIRLESIHGGYRSVMVASGPEAFLNLPGGVLDINGGSGGERWFSGLFINQGIVDARDYFFDIYGSYETAGGRILGAGRLQSVHLSVTGAPSEPSVLDLWGSTTLLTDNLPNTTLWIHGNGFTGDAVLTKSGDLNNRGTIRLESSHGGYRDVLNVGGLLMNAPGALLEMNPGSGGERLLNIVLDNLGRIDCSYFGTLGRVGAQHLNSGIIRLLNGYSLSVAGVSLQNTPTGRIEGNGNFDASGLAFQNDGTISPGVSPGALTFTGTFNQSAQGRVLIELSGLTAGSQYDRFHINGTANLNGTLVVAFLDGWYAVHGDLYTVLTYAAKNGQFADVQSPPLMGGAHWEPTYSSTFLELRALGDENDILPRITQQLSPMNQTTLRGRAVTFQLTASGTTPITYYWQHNGVVVANTGVSSLTLNNVQPTDAGGYSVIVSNHAGTVTSRTVSLNVLSCQALPFGLVGWWAGDGDADELASGRQGALQNGASFASGKVGQAFHFDGVDDFVDVPNAESLELDGSFTIQAWIRTSTATERGTVLSKYECGGACPGTATSAYILYVVDGVPFGFVRASGVPAADGQVVRGSSSVADGRFHHVAVVRNVEADKLSLYIDGILDNEMPLEPVARGPLHDDDGEADPITIGAITRAGTSGREQFFKGDVDELSIFGRALTSNEIGAVFTAGGAGWCNLNEQRITFEELPNGTAISNQFAARGVLFETRGANLRITDAFPANYVPVSPTHVFGDPVSLSGTTGEVTFSFVLPGTSTPATVTYFSFFIIDATSVPASVRAFDSEGGIIFTNSYTGPVGAAQLVAIAHPRIARVHVTLGRGAVDTSAIDDITFSTPNSLNHRPSLVAIGDKSIDENNLLTFLVTATDSDPLQNLFFALEPGAPTGATIHPATGVFRWTPDESQGPGNYAIGVVVTDNAVTPLTATNRFAVSVREVNERPQLAAIAPLLASSNAPVNFTAMAFDSDLPPQSLRFALLNPPPGAAIEPTTGAFTWIIPPGFPEGPISLSVTASDDGAPPLTATQTVVVTIKHSGPRVVTMTPSGDTHLPFGFVDVTFNEEIRAGTFTLSDMFFIAPEGAVPVTGLQQLTTNVWRLSFAPQLTAGAYQLRLGPNLSDLAGNPMNQDGDGINGELVEDRFVGELRLHLPDLAVIAVSVPGNIVAGQPVTLSYVLTNRGDFSAVGTWSDAVRLATNANGINGQLLGAPAFDAHIPVNGFLVRTQTVIVPPTLRGTGFITIETDSAGQVVESNETNNARVASAPISITAPDLNVTEFVAPASGFFASNIFLRWSVQNGGDGVALAQWTDRVMLSAFSNSLTGARLLTSVSAAEQSPLAPGNAYTRNLAVALPLSSQLSTGVYYLHLLVDEENRLAEGSEANNTAISSIRVDFPPLPDLAVTSVNASAQVGPDSSILISYVVTNGGQANLIAAAWREQISVSNAINGLAAVGTFDVTNSLLAGHSTVRSNWVVLPQNIVAGQQTFFVTVDRLNEVVEENEANNMAAAANQTTLRATLTLSFSAAQIAETASLPLRATLTRNGVRDQPLLVSLSNSHPSELSYVSATITPAVTNITIPANQSVIVFDLYPVRDNAVDQDKQVEVTAVAPGYDVASAAVTVLNTDQPSLSLHPQTNVVSEGQSVVVRLTRDVVTSNALTVALNSSHPTQLSPPAFVTISPGSNSAVFEVLAVDDVLAEPSSSYSLAATASGFNNGSAAITVLDNDVPALTVQFSQHTISEGAGPQATVATITRIPASLGTLTVEITASVQGLLQFPSQVTFSSGQAVKSFPVGVVNDTLANGTRTVLLGVYALAAGSNTRLGQATPDTLTVLDDDGPALRVVATQKLVREGLNPATVVGVIRNTPATNELAITVSIDRTSEARLGSPAVSIPNNPGHYSLAIPSGAQAASMPLVTLSDGTNDGSQTVTLTARANGFTEGVETVVVTDSDLPDLVVASVSVPAAAVPQERVSINYRVVNQGVSATTASFLTRVYLSRDAVMGDDVLVAQERVTNSIPVDEFGQANAVQVQMPLGVGNYWVVVETDAEHTVDEVLENNNITIAAVPIAVSANYGAWVQTDVTNAPAGTPVPLLGRATNTLGAGVATVPVNVHIRVRGVERTLSVTTDSNGSFATVFQPLPGEAGRYELFATHPGVGAVPVQDTFSLLGFRASPANVSLTVIEGSSQTGTITLENLSEVPLHGLAVSELSKPANLQVMASISDAQLDAQSLLHYQFTALAADAYGTVRLRVMSDEGLAQEILFGVSVEPLRPRLVATPASLYAGMPLGGQAVVEFEIVNLGGRDSGAIIISLPAVPWIHLASTNPLPSLAPGQTNHVTLVLQPDTNVALGPYTGSIAINSHNGGVSVPFTFRAVKDAVGDLAVDVVDEFTYYAQGAPHVASASVTVRDAYTQTNVATGMTGLDGLFVITNLQEGYYEVEVTAAKHTTYRATHRVEAGIANEMQAFVSRQMVTYTWNVEPVEVEDRYRVTVESTFETVVPAPVIVIEPSAIDLADLTGDETQIDVRISNHGLIAAKDFNVHFNAHPLWEITPLLTQLGDVAANSSITLPLTIHHLRAQPFMAADTGWIPCSFTGTGTWGLECGGRVNSYSAVVNIVNAGLACGPSATPPPTPERLVGGSIADPYFFPPSIGESCNPLCISEGSISGGEVLPSNATIGYGETLLIKANGARDSGGTVLFPCRCNPIEIVPSAPVQYEYEVTKPSGQKYDGAGDTIPILGDELGTYVCRFFALARRNCSPERIFVGESQIECVINLKPKEVDARNPIAAVAYFEILPPEAKFDSITFYVNGQVKMTSMGIDGISGIVSFVFSQLELSQDGNLLTAVGKVYADSGEKERKANIEAGRFHNFLSGGGRICARIPVSEGGDNFFYPVGMGQIPSVAVDDWTYSVPLVKDSKTIYLGALGLSLVIVPDTMGQYGDVSLWTATAVLLDSAGSVAREILLSDTGGGINAPGSSTKTGMIDFWLSPSESATVRTRIELVLIAVDLQNALVVFSPIDPLCLLGDSRTADIAVQGQAAAMPSLLPSQMLTQSEVAANHIFGEENYRAAPANSGICAHVKLSLEQQAVITRTAFRATLEITMNGGTRLEDVQVMLDVRDETGSSATSLFDIRLEGTTALSAVDGTGILSGNTVGTARWLLIPSVDAAPRLDTKFLVSGTLHYRLDGQNVTLAMEPAPITVLPSPRLTLEYFHQRDVFSDDPFTPQIEPAIPYSLAVMVQNHGYGVAKNFRITSAQPEIIENEKGLLIDFNIIATEVFKSGESYGLTPSLTANFGNINAGDTAIGRWLLTSTLQGLFIDYSATFEHIDGLGNPRLSLIDAVRIHEMIHLVQAGGQWEDNKPDFLVNEVPDVLDLPDTLYQSNGSTNPVEIVQQATNDGAPTSSDLVVQLSAPMPRAGWGYLRVPDPGHGEYRLTRVRRRGDGVDIPVSTNVWTTDRTFIGLGRRPIYENILHLLDYNSDGNYNLTYAVGQPVTNDTNPPSSSVTNLPPTSPEYFQVSWSGQDAGLLGQALAGIAYYDIFVSENHGPFTNWLPRTTLVSATYVGKIGSHYAFYSVATDANGNRELPPGVPDAETVILVTNSPPVIVLPSTVATNEGQTLIVPFSASDPDANQSLNFSVLPGAPLGITLDANSRRLTWPTGEGNGPSTNRVCVVVRDNGIPSLSATGCVTVVIYEVNTAPTLAPLRDWNVKENQQVLFTASASDSDLPRNTLSFHLLGALPSSAALDPVSGVFQWRPGDLDGGYTYDFAIVVRDGGIPGLSATQRVSITVRDTTPDFELTIGTTNVLRGHRRAVPLRLRTGLDLAQLSFSLPTSDYRLENLNLEILSDAVKSARLLPNGAGTVDGLLVATDGQTLQGDQNLAQLVFDAPSQGASEIARFNPSALAGQTTAGESVTSGKAVGGRVFVIGREPILDVTLSSNQTRGLTLYGQPGTNYVVELSTTLNPNDWSLFRRTGLTGTYEGLTPTIDVRSNQFYRARLELTP